MVMISGPGGPEREPVTSEDKALTQLAQAAALLQVGLVERVTEENLPDLKSQYPERFATLRLEAISLKISQLESLYPIVDDDADARISTQVKKLEKEASQIIKELFPGEPDEESKKRPFVLTDQQEKWIKFAVEGGFIDLLEERMPFLRHLPEKDFLTLRIQAYSAAIERWKQVSEANQPAAGIGALQEEKGPIFRIATMKLEGYEEKLKELALELEKLEKASLKKSSTKTTA